ncbi:MAG: hypothetical protein HQK60_01830 [Deltaproteobacteria bacterium]|nr:hypothetical protein [Deltaproteobacteria bacterium]
MYKFFEKLSRYSVTCIFLWICAYTISGCSTYQAVNTNPKDYRAIAAASCTDLTNISMVAIAATTIIESEMNNQSFAAKADPIIKDIQLSIQVYCSASQLVQDVTGWQSILTQQNQILKLVSEINALVPQIKNTVPPPVT